MPAFVEMTDDERAITENHTKEQCLNSCKLSVNPLKSGELSVIIRFVN